MLLAASVGFLLLAPEAAAETAPPKEVAPVTVEAPAGEKLVCRQIQPLGSKVPKRVCYKKAEMERSRQDARQITEDLQRGKEAFYRPIEP